MPSTVLAKVHITAQIYGSDEKIENFATKNFNKKSLNLYLFHILLESSAAYLMAVSGRQPCETFTNIHDLGSQSPFTPRVAITFYSLPNTEAISQKCELTRWPTSTPPCGSLVRSWLSPAFPSCLLRFASRYGSLPCLLVLE